MVGNDNNAENLSQFEIAVAGATAGAFTRLICQPFDVLKIRFQLQVEPIKRSSYESKYKAVVQACRVLWKEEGFRGLWLGHVPAQLLSIIYGLVHFSTFEFLSNESYKVLSPGKHLVSDFTCGVIAGAMATTSSYPFDTVRTRFIAQGRQAPVEYRYDTMFEGLRKMVKKEGWLAPYKGMSLSLLQGAPQAGVAFLVFNVSTELLGNKNLFSAGDSLTLSGNLISGSVAGLASKVAVYPLDVARKRLQFQGFQNARVGFGQNFTCKGVVNCLAETYTNEGVRGLYKGLAPSLVKAAVTTALHFAGYKEACRFLARQHSSS